MITLTIQEPFFWSKQDEESFFAWVKSIPAIQDVSGHSQGLDLGVDQELLDTEQLRELLGLHMRFGLNMRSLAILETEANTHWFRDPEAYWFNRVFEENEK